MVLLGGGGFSADPADTTLDDYTLALTGVARPRVCFLPTASGDALSYIEKFRDAFGPSRARASFLPLFRRNPGQNPAEHLLAQHVIYIGGGNTANALAVWRVHGVDKALLAAWRKGVVITGVSAGLLCWFNACLTDSYGDLAPLQDGLRVLPGAACPHYDGEPGRRAALHAAVATRALPDTLAVDDYCAVHFVGRRLHRVLAARPDATAHYVTRIGRTVSEEPLPADLLEPSA